jgi:hypothetical protein
MCNLYSITANQAAIIALRGDTGQAALTYTGAKPWSGMIN